MLENLGDPMSSYEEESSRIIWYARTETQKRKLGNELT